MTLSAVIRGVSAWGPGLEGWAATRAVLAGEAAYQPRPSPPPASVLLPPTERRRSGPVVRLALAVAQEAAEASGVDPALLRPVFASSNGDGPVVGAILQALAESGGERVVSPTQFHNSVHNAAAGYWTIAVGSRQPATCLGCHDDSWAAGLLTALAEQRAAGAPVLLCCYDHPLPEPLARVRPTGPAFAAALVLAGAGPGPTLTVESDPAPLQQADGVADPALQALALANPAARALPLLAALARGVDAAFDLAYLEGRLRLRLQH